MNAAGWRRAEPAVVLVGMAALGALQTLAFVHTAWWPLPLLALALLCWRLDRSTPRHAALLGWCYGTAWLCAGVWWLFISMHTYGGLPALLAAAAVFALCAALSLYMAAACAAYAKWRRGTGFDVLLFAAVFLLAELARGLIFTGFPWLAAAYAQVDGPLAALAPWLGVYGVGAVGAAGAAALAHCATRRPLLPSLLPLAAVSALVGAAFVAPSSFTQAAGEISVALLQTNVKQDEKFSAERMPELMAWVARELLASTADLTVAPETAVPLLPAQLADFAPGYWAALAEHFNSHPGHTALVGVPLGSYSHGYTNSVAGLSTQPMYRYDKQHLVPFGEFIPTGFRWFTELMNIPLGDFARGVDNPPSFAVHGQRIGPNICYEDLFGEELARRFVSEGAAPTVLVNISNIGWFGNTVAIPQHLQISRFRTLELQRPMLRATNTGATAVIDHQGQVLKALPSYSRGVLLARVQGRQGTTPFVWWVSRLGLWPLVGAALLTVWLFSRRRRAV